METENSFRISNAANAVDKAKHAREMARVAESSQSGK